MIIENIVEYVGNTPMVKVNYGQDSGANVYLKLEEYNPGASVKTRIAFQMILDAEEQGILTRHSGQVIIEPTGGNTGIGLAIAGAALGYKVVLVTPDNYSQEKKDVLRAYGAKVILSDHTKGNDSHVQKVNEMVSEDDQYVYLNQFQNPSNPHAHFVKTGEEIIDDLSRENKKVDVFVAGIGSGGTLIGVGKKLKEVFYELSVIGVQPEGCEVLKEKFVPHKIQGIGAVLTSFVEPELIDDVLSVRYEEALYWMRYVARNMGILIGISAGANVAAAVRLAKQMTKDKNIVTIAPDSGRSYLDLFVDESEASAEEPFAIV